MPSIPQIPEIVAEASAATVKNNSVELSKTPTLVPPANPPSSKDRQNYNNTFAFTSLGVSVNCSVYCPHAVYPFRIKGELCHRIGSLLPTPDGEPAFAQIYVFDNYPERQANARMSHHCSTNGGYLLDCDRVISLQEIAAVYNPYVLTY
jgi:hypothetical protein